MNQDKACKYVYDALQDRKNKDQAYAPWLYMREALSSQLALEFNTTQDQIKKLPFYQIKGKASTILCRIFEGMPTLHNWTKEEVKELKLMLAKVDMLQFDLFSRELFVTQQLNKVLNDLIQIASN